MTLDFNTAIESLVNQSPFVGVAIYVARIYMQKHESAIAKLVETFEGEVKACEARYQMVFDELMKIKEQLK